MEYSGKESSGEGVTGVLNLNERFMKLVEKKSS
jgi:hypothetical protein